jgi:23S rRNA (uracil1939-C5)-methyltransferase
LRITGASPTLSADRRASIIQAADKLSLARLSINGEVAMERTPPILRMGGVDVTPPPGGFLQATQESETAMVALVCEALVRRSQVVDLFSGAGTFTLPLAATASVHAVEGEVAGSQALAARYARCRASNLSPPKSAICSASR